MIDNQSSVPIAKESQGRSLGGRVALSVSLLVWLFAPLLSSAAQITANSVAQKDVASAIAAASDGDTVIIPAGIAYWTNTLTITNKAITLSGAGTNKTIIVDELVNRTIPLLQIFFQKTTGVFRLTGLQFKGGVTNTTPNVFGVITITGSDLEYGNSLWRIDNCYFNQVKARPVYVYAWSGLIDQCVFDRCSLGLSFDGRITLGPTQWGDRSWATPVRWGTIDSGVYVENCYVTNVVQRGLTDGYAGARFVVRHSVLRNACIQTHGTESTSRARGTRSLEVYNNDFFTTMASEWVVLFRSGTGLVFSNNVTGAFPGLLHFSNYRERDPYTPWGQANGKNPIDLNYPGVFASGNHNGLTGSELVDTSKKWAINQWIGYHIINLATGVSGQIRSNSASTIVCWPSLFTANRLSWTSGHTYEIRKVNKSLDMPGAGMSDMLVGNPTTWLNQRDEPIHYWANSGVSNVDNSGYYTIVAGRNYTNAPLPGYTSLIYPHPLVKLSEAGGRDGYVAPPSGLQVVPPQ